MDKRLDSLTGLRFLAALAIVIHHSSVFTGWQNTELSCTVSLFFVLSGFVLAWSCGGMAAGTFWRRRAARIVPIYLLAAVIGLLLPGGWGPPDWVTWVTSLTLVQAWFPQLAIAFGGNGVAWSLSVEAFFYLLFPLAWIVLSRLQPRSRRTVGFGCAAFVTLAGAAPDAWHWAVYVFPVARLPEFVLGMVTALAVRDGWRPKLWPPLLGLVPAGFVAYAVATPARYDYEFATIICFALIVPALAAKELDGRPGLLATRRMVALGSASYALYLFHQLVYRGVAVVMSDTNLAIGPRSPDPVKLLVAAIAIGLALAVAEVVHHRVEIPMQRRLQGKRLGGRPPDIDPAGGPDRVVVLDPPGG